MALFESLNPYPTQTSAQHLNTRSNLSNSNKLQQRIIRVKKTLIRLVNTINCNVTSTGFSVKKCPTCMNII